MKRTLTLRMVPGYNPAMRNPCLALLLALAACSPDAPQAAAPTSEKIKLEDPSGAVLLSLRARPDGYKLHGPADEVVGELKVQDDRVKLKDEKDVETWKIKRKDYGAEVETPDGRRLFKIKKDGEGWKLEDAAEKTLAKAKKKDSGFELRDAAGQTIVKAKARDGKVALEAEDGTRLRTLDGDADPQAAMWLSMDSFSPGQRAALWAFFRRVWK